MKTITGIALLLTSIAPSLGCGGSSSSSSSGCCLSGTYYSCSSQTAATNCFQNNDTSGCSHDSSKDSTDGGLTCNG